MAKAWGELVFVTSEDKEPVILTKRKFVIGRAKDCDLCILRKRVSNRHCYLELVETGNRSGEKSVCLYDTSSNGTFVNRTSKFLKNESTTLKSGDSFQIGYDRNVRDSGFTLMFRAKSEALNAGDGETEEYVLDDDGDIILVSDSEVATEAKKKDEEAIARLMAEKEANGEREKVEKGMNEEMLSNLTCTICHDVFYKCVTLQPCVHCFCGGCYSDWMCKSNECPQCRSVVQQIAPNHIMNNIVETFLKQHPSFKRDQSDIEEQDKKNRVTRVMAFPLSLKRFYPFDDDYNEEDDDDFDPAVHYDYEGPLDSVSGDESLHTDNDTHVDTADSYEESVGRASQSPMSSVSSGSYRSNASPVLDDVHSVHSESSRRGDSPFPRRRTSSSSSSLSSSSPLSSIHEIISSVSSSRSGYNDLSSSTESSSEDDSDEFSYGNVVTCRHCEDSKRSTRRWKRMLDPGAGSSNVGAGGSGSSGSSLRSEGRHLQYTCTREQVHLMCLCCREYMPRRAVIYNKDGTSVPPQSCSNCFSLYCHMYWGCRGPNCNGCLAPFDKLDFSGCHLETIINNNLFESEVLFRYLEGNEMDWKDLLKECILRLKDGTFTVTTCLKSLGDRTFDQLADQALCKTCGLKMFAELAYQYRGDIHNDELPLSVTERMDCYWGSSCRSQNKYHHAKRFNHICAQTRHGDD